MSEVVIGIVSRLNQDNQTEYLLVSSKKDFGKFTGYYYPPGGHIEKGETKKQALLREFNEELGIDVEPVREIDITSGDIENQTTYWWICKTKSDNLKINEAEIADANFFTEDKIRLLKLWPSTEKFFETHIFNKR